MVDLKPSLTLLLGGARSGKSRLAVEMASASGRRVLYVASALPSDEEMRERIAEHQRERRADWRTLEEPLAIAERIEAVTTAGDIVVLDCLTVWLGNLLHSIVSDVDNPSPEERTKAKKDAFSELGALCGVRDRDVSLIVISNEVGAGVVPAHPLGRLYRDILGELNQELARRADSALLVVAGLPVDLKDLSSARVRAAIH